MSAADAQKARAVGIGLLASQAAELLRGRRHRPIDAADDLVEMKGADFDAEAAALKEIMRLADQINE